MEAAAALDHAVSKLAIRSRVAELAVHGNMEWSVLVGHDLVPVEVAAGLTDEGVVVSFLLAKAPLDNDVWLLHANGELMQSVPGRMVAGHPCRLRLVLDLAPAVPLLPAGV